MEIFSLALLPDDILVLFVLPLRVLPPPIHYGRIDVGGAVRVGLVQEAHHRQEYRPAEDGRSLIIKVCIVTEINALNGIMAARNLEFDVEA